MYGGFALFLNPLLRCITGCLMRENKKARWSVYRKINRHFQMVPSYSWCSWYAQVFSAFYMCVKVWSQRLHSLLGELQMSLVWISKPFVSRSEEEAMSLSVFYYCICPWLCRCRSFNPSLCHLSPFRLSNVAISRPCRLSKFTLTGPR